MEFSDLLIAALKDIASAFNDNKINYCLSGGLAVSILSTPRATEDIDIEMKAPSKRARDQADVENLRQDKP